MPTKPQAAGLNTDTDQINTREIDLRDGMCPPGAHAGLDGQCAICRPPVDEDAPLSLGVKIFLTAVSLVAVAVCILAFIGGDPDPINLIFH